MKFLSCLICLFISSSALASPLSYFKNRDIDIIPVPVFETRPDKGNSYGLLPVLLFTDKESKNIKAILGAIGQYNSVVKASGGVLGYIYPHPDEEIEFYTELGQRYTRELTLHFLDPSFFDHYYLDINSSYLKTPFDHFFGLGPKTTESTHSNYVSRAYNLDLTAGRYLFNHFRAEAITRFHTNDLQGRAMSKYSDTLTTFAALPEVVDSTNWINGGGFVFDNRKDGPYSTKGSLFQVTGFGSSKSFGSDQTFGGYNVEAIQILEEVKNRTHSVWRFTFQRVFGQAPFYELSSLGGANELRSFIPQRFVDQGKMAFQWEQRIRLFDMTVLGNHFSTYADPFFEVGRVFNRVSALGFNDWQPVGGLGLRLFVPPNVTGRMDIAIGSDGLEIYTALGYPF